MSYYAERAARDPAWRLAQLAGARERERAARERDPDVFRARQRRATARTRERQRRHGLTFQELLRRCREAAGTTALAIGDPDVLRTVLNDEVRRGRVDFHSTSQRYELNGGLPADVRLALRDLEL